MKQSKPAFFAIGLAVLALLAPMFAFMFAFMAPAAAAHPQTRDLIKRCYRLSPNFDGPIWVNFCLADFGSKFTVRGAEFCRGKLRWRLRGGRLTARLGAADCRSGEVWPAATLVCRVTGITGRGLHDGLGPIEPGHFGPFPFPDRLRCTYTENDSGQTFSTRALKR